MSKSFVLCDCKTSISLPCSPIYKDECSYCFANPTQGIDLCLFCFCSFCSSSAEGHSDAHFNRHPQHHLFVRISRPSKAKVSENSDVSYSENPEFNSPLKKLAIEIPPSAAGEEETSFSLCCKRCKKEEIPLSEDFIQQFSLLPSVAAVESQKNWTLELKECSHSRSENASSSSKLEIESLPLKCNCCSLTNNLWLCLECGHAGCGRKFWDGSGGNNHAFEHFSTSQHPICVKIGTIGKSNSAPDFYCYACDEAICFPEWKKRFLNCKFTDNASQEKSTLELELELNESFSPSNAAAVICSKVSGPNCVGIKNIGNSCYISSILQCILKNSSMKNFFLTLGLLHSTHECTEKAPECLECQCTKICISLAKGDSLEINPKMLKCLLSRSFGRFGDSKQQDAHEFCEFFLEALQERIPGIQAVIRDEFEIVTKTRLKCTVCGGVCWRQDWSKVMIVPLPEEGNWKESNENGSESNEKGNERKESNENGKEREEIVNQCNENNTNQGNTIQPANQCNEKENSQQIPNQHQYINIIDAISRLFQETQVEFQCQGCGNNNFIAKTSIFHLPSSPIVVFSRYSMNTNTLMPQKNLIHLQNASNLDLSEFVLRKEDEILQEDEYLLPESSSSSSDCESHLSLLESMGFERSLCLQALKATKGQGIEAATEWLFSIGNVQSTNERENPISTAFSLCGVVEHRGTNTASGHYIAYEMMNVVDQQESPKWIMFNDEQVGVVENREFLESGYIYFYNNNKSFHSSPS